jgi:hypothetical protein
MGLWHTREEFFEFVGVRKVGRDSLVDRSPNGIVPKCGLLCKRTEANHVTRAARGRIGSTDQGTEVLTTCRHQHREGPKRRCRTVLGYLR